MVQLHNHSAYSFLDGKSTPKEMVARAKALGQPAIALTDHGNMHGVIEFYEAAKKEGVKPIIGCEVYVAPESRFDRTGSFSGEGGRSYYHLILLAKNNEGYKNLCRLITLAYEEGHHYKPRVDKELLKRYHEGLIATSACVGGEIPQTLLDERMTAGEAFEKAREAVREYVEIFGKEDFYIELQNHYIPEEIAVRPLLERLAKEEGLKVIVANDAHYPEKEDAKAHDVMLCIQTKSLITEVERFKFHNDEFYIKSDAEMLELFPQEYLDNTMEIAEKCDVHFDFYGFKLPHFVAPPEWEENHGGYLIEICRQGAKEKLPGKWNEEYTKRLKSEYDIIAKKGFIDYFLILWDVINWAKEQNIAVGPGRGSACGSLIAYLMGITNVDPLKYTLFFERFLSMERPSNPDIDTDFEDSRRDEVIEYVRKKYGKDYVASIATFGTMSAKAVLKDVARVYGVPFSEANALTKAFPDRADTLDKAIEGSAQLRATIASNQKYKEIWKIAKQLEGLPRQTGIHPAGVVISDKPITEYVPLMTVKGEQVVQFPKKQVEKLGLLKMDFLGLRTLSVIKDVSEAVRKKYDSTFDIDKINMEDPEVFQMLSRGETDGVFQFESSGMTSYMKQLAPENIEDLIALNALYRPGPMDHIPEFIERKHNPSLIEYPVQNNEDIKQILKPTLGIICYQEQILEIFQKLGGFSLGAADIVRRAMSDKDDAVMREQFSYFVHGKKGPDGEILIAGAISKGIPEKEAWALTELMNSFSEYAFNKSHAAAYSILAYQTAYLKYYYPEEFIAATMSSYIGKNDELGHYINVCKHVMNVPIVLPDINISEQKFVVNDKKEVVFAINGLKYVGEKLSAAILNERNRGGKFVSLYDFIIRMKDKGLDINGLEALIKTDAFKFTGVNRTTLLNVADEYVTLATENLKRKKNGQKTIFSLLPEGVGEAISMPSITPLEDNEDVISRWEKEITHLYISVDPLKKYQKLLEVKGVHTISKIKREIARGSYGFRTGNSVIALAVIGETNIFTTKAGDFMSKPILEDGDASMQGIVFPKMFNGVEGRFFKTMHTPVIIKATIKVTDEGTSELIVQSATDAFSDAYLEDKGMDAMMSIPAEFGLKRRQIADQRIAKRQQRIGQSESKNRKKGLYLHVKDETLIPEVLKLGSKYPGMTKVYLYVDTETRRALYDTNVSVYLNNEAFKNEIRRLFNAAQIKVVG